jgi:hypothetical protein
MYDLNLFVGVAPLDLGGAALEVSGYIAGAAGAGVAVFALVYGVRAMVRAFKVAGDENRSWEHPSEDEHRQYMDRMDR